MEIAPGIDIIGPSLWLRKEKTLIINDLHLGYEEALHKKGVLVPKQQYGLVIKELKEILAKVQPQRIVINGDLKHEFGTVSRQEWRDVLDLLDFLLKKCPEVILIQGNHDPIIKPLAEKKNLQVVSELNLGKILIAHGDELVETSAKTIIIGHEHTAITIREGSKFEKFKCFLKGRWRKKELIVVPSFNPLLEGTDVLQEKLLSPFLENISTFNVYVISKGEVFEFGKVKNIKT
ncbi:metallophosphoesterase [Candidatus Woesearchaeota archaeon]|nr:metallophosphoesterase [Candidatus Woesearchaeota archaeon]